MAYGDPYYLDTIELIVGLGDGDGYDWHVLNVYKAEDGNYYWIEASGCSCNSLEEDVDSTADMTPLNAQTWREFETAVMGFGDYYSGSTSGDDKIKVLSTMSNLVPRLVPYA